MLLDKCSGSELLLLNAKKSAEKNRDLILKIKEIAAEYEFSNEIENQTDYLFIINSNIDTHQKVSVRADDTPVSKVLDELFHDTEIHYTMEGSHIVLSNKPQPAILQQTRKITGRILDENGEPLIGVSVMLKGTSNGTITNIDGDYTLSGDITDKSVLEVTYIGMKKQEITVGNRTRINITMTSDNEMLDEVIVVGYGTQKKVNLSGAVESVGGKTLANRATNSIGTMLQGIVPVSYTHLTLPTNSRV